MNWYHEPDCVTVWPGAAGPLLMALASLGKEWPSFLWTRHSVRSPGSGRPFHFMVHRPLSVIMPCFQVQRRKCFVKLMSLSMRCGSPFFCQACHWLVNYHSHVKSDPTPVSSSLALTANERLHMLQRRCSSGLICIGWMEIRRFNVEAKLVNCAGINTLNTHAYKTTWMCPKANWNAKV